MRKILFFLMLFCAVAMSAQTSEKLGFEVSAEVGLPLPETDDGQHSLLLSADYSFTPRLRVGLGSGLTRCRSTMVPLFATLCWSLSKPRAFTPFVALRMGCSVATASDERGGFGYSPSIGVDYALGQHRSLFLSVGYSCQSFCALRSYSSPVLSAQFTEHVSSLSFVVKGGVRF